MQQVAAAFIKAKRAFGPVLKAKTNPAFKSRYADLEACLEAVDGACLDAGIALYQETSEDATGVTVETVFLHESGEALRCGKLHVPASKQDPQGYGSALTYARRYSLLAACGIAAEDDDGNAASRGQAKGNEGERKKWLADWISYIKEATSTGDLTKRTNEAVQQAKELKDADAEGQFLAAKADKLATVKPATKEAA